MGSTLVVSHTLLLYLGVSSSSFSGRVGHLDREAMALYLLLVIHQLVVASEFSLTTRHGGDTF